MNEVKPNVYRKMYL